MTTVAVCGVIAGVVVGVGWLAMGILAEPDLPMVAAGDEARASQKLAQMVASGRSRPRQSVEVVSFTEGELNALLSRRLAQLAELPLSRVHLRLAGGGRADVAGRIPVAALLGERPLNRLANLLPVRWQQTPVWLRLRVHARVESMDEGRRRYLRLDVERFWLGRRRLPSILHRVVLSPATMKVLHVRLPESVREVRVEHGRIDVTKAATP